MNSKIENSLKIGTVINEKWVVLEFIAKGGMGEVYRAHQLNLKRDVAIKVVSKEWLETLLDDEEEKLSGLERFRNEVQAMAQAQHPNILQIFDYGTFFPEDGQEEGPLEYIVMEYVPGSTLRSTMSEEGFYPEEGLLKEWIVKYFMPVLDGVEALHNLGIIHRDLKPENVLIDKNVPKIADFGLAHSSKLKPVTHSADMKGTPAYMPPEQFLDFRRTDERTDIYALGKILYEAVEGKIPPNTLPFKQSRLGKADTPFFKKIDFIIQKATEEEKEARISSIDELRKMLQQGLALGPTSKYRKPSEKQPSKGWEYYISRKKKLIFASALIIIILVVLVLWFSRTPKELPSITSHLQNGEGNLSKVEKIVPGPKRMSVNWSSSPLPKALNMEDGVVLHLVSGGNISLPDGFEYGGGKSIAVKSFYMDETLVTNHQYVDFLNQVIKVIEVKHDVVRGEGKIWFFLGQALPGYEPIIYKQGRFHINKPAHASCPVIRVTAYGAEAYARFYGRRLPTASEWIYALIKGGQDNSPPVPTSIQSSDENWDQSAMSNMMEMMHKTTNEPRVSAPESPEPPHFPSPVLNSRPNKLGIRGLNGNISEWGIVPAQKGKQKQRELVEYIILGGLEGVVKKDKRIPPFLVRKPWEAFEEVGFRTVFHIPTAQP